MYTDNEVQLLNDILIKEQKIKKQSNKIFDIFDTQKKGIINYNELINTVLGKMNDFRRQIVQKAFEKLDKENKGKICYDVIRDNYNADKHPEVLNGKRTKQEILARFIDMVEYHFNLLNNNKNNNEANQEEFEEFYNYISVFIDNDKYFEGKGDSNLIY